jgi:hypothetical protein
MERLFSWPGVLHFLWVFAVARVVWWVLVENMRVPTWVRWIIEPLPPKPAPPKRSDEYMSERDFSGKA